MSECIWAAHNGIDDASLFMEKDGSAVLHARYHRDRIRVELTADDVQSLRMALFPMRPAEKTAYCPPCGVHHTVTQELEDWAAQHIPARPLDLPSSRAGEDDA